jgi:hypothetical protein
LIAVRTDPTISATSEERRMSAGSPAVQSRQRTIPDAVMTLKRPQRPMTSRRQPSHRRPPSAAKPSRPAAPRAGWRSRARRTPRALKLQRVRDLHFLAVNLAHDVATGRRTVDDARTAYAEMATAFVMGRPAPYTEELKFTPPQGGTADVDETHIAAAMINQTAENIKDVVRRAS